MGTEKFTTGPGSVGDFPTTDAATGTHRIATAFLAAKPPELPGTVLSLRETRYSAAR